MALSSVTLVLYCSVCGTKVVPCVRTSPAGHSYPHTHWNITRIPILGLGFSASVVATCVSKYVCSNLLIHVGNLSSLTFCGLLLLCPEKPIHVISYLLGALAPSHFMLTMQCQTCSPWGASGCLIRWKLACMHDYLWQEDHAETNLPAFAHPQSGQQPQAGLLWACCLRVGLR